MFVFDSIGGESVCRGKTSGGTVSGSTRLPAYGENYRTYCLMCIPALRTYGHNAVIDTTEEAFRELSRTHPNTRFVYGEVGFPWGGRFPPHRTHQNGLSIDFMVPLVGDAEIPTTLWNRFGFDAEYDTDGTGDGGQIDFDAIAAHLLALDAAARKRGGQIHRVFFAPDLQDDLFAAESGGAVRDTIQFNKKQSWVRHDDHYHVDFVFKCE